MAVSVAVEILQLGLVATAGWLAEAGADAETIAGLDAAGTVLFGLVFAPLGASVLAGSLAMLATRGFPRWLGWLGVISRNARHRRRRRRHDRRGRWAARARGPRGPTHGAACRPLLDLDARDLDRALPSRFAMTQPETWHHGLVAQWWSEFNDDFRSHELPYFQRFVEAGQPALDVGCGTGRLLVPFLRAGLDVDGCDVSADMIAACREKATREGLSPNLYVQPMHELDLPRRYRTIYVCGSFGLGSDRERDRQALERFGEYLEPEGTLLIDIEVPYADASQWKYWTKGERPRCRRPSTRRADGARERTAPSTRCARAPSTSIP